MHLYRVAPAKSDAADTQACATVRASTTHATEVMRAKNGRIEHPAARCIVLRTSTHE